MRVTFLALFLLLAISLATMTWMVGRDHRVRGREGVREWSTGLGLQAIAWPLFAVEGLVPQAIASGLLLAGHTALGRGLLRSLRTGAPGVWVYAPAVLLVALLALPAWMPSQRIALFWGFAVLAALRFAWPLLRQQRRRLPWARRAAAGVLSGSGVVAVARLVEQLLHPQDSPAFDGGISPAQAVALGYFLLAPVFATFAFLMLQMDRQRAWLEGLAAQDPLTGINNRRAFLAAVDASTTPGDAALGALLMIDVDAFKDINDEHGHAAGDALLRRIAAALQAVSGPRDVVGRFGGDEFMMLLVGVSPGEAIERAERLRRTIAAVTAKGGVPSATLSIGIAHARLDRALDVDRLLLQADRRLYFAKRSGRDRVIATDDGAEGFEAADSGAEGGALVDR